MKRVIVLGGGIGGVEAAIHLRKKGLEVELVSDRDYLFVYPLAIWIPTGERSFERVKMSLGEIGRAHGFKLTVDRVVGISAADRSFTLENAGLRDDFDYLVVALGASQDASQGQGARALHLRSARRERRGQAQARQPDRPGLRDHRGGVRWQSEGQQRGARGPGIRATVERAPSPQEARVARHVRPDLLRPHAQAGHPHGREGREHYGHHVPQAGHRLVHRQEDHGVRRGLGDAGRRHEVRR